MKIVKKILTVMVLFLLSGQLSAQINLPSFFSDNMVLQRNAEVNFWGWGSRYSEVVIKPSWSEEIIKVKITGHSRFDTKLKTPEAGGPYEIVIESGRFKKVIKNILIGEVWLCSGQSNMQWNSFNKHQEMLDELPNANNPRIRLLQVSHIASSNLQDNLHDSWKESNTESVAGFSSIAYFIAKQLSSELDIPVGIINSSWGGTSAEVWTPEEIINSDEELIANAKMLKPSDNKPHEPGALWNSMIRPFAGYKIAGTFWYQGESNTETHRGYNKLFSKMIGSWRNAWGYEFPFYYVQIAPYSYKSLPGEQKGALLREQQVKTLNVPKTGMVVTTDLVPDIKNIHPSKKIDVAKRLSELALVEVYGKKAEDHKSPVYRSHEIEGNKVVVEFDFLKGDLKVAGKEISDLFIADESQNFVKADFNIVNNKLIVFSKSVKKPVAVRFGFSDISMPNLFNNKGLPVSPFRTDNWDL